MADILTALVKEVPAVAAIIVVVVVFLRHITAERDSRKEDRQAFLAALQQRDERTHAMITRADDTQQKSAVALDRSTVQHARTEPMLNRLELQLGLHNQPPKPA